MNKLRLGPLPKTTPVKLTISVSTALREQLERYAELHAKTWQEPVSTERLIPYILEQFLVRDKAFRAALRASTASASPER